MTTAFGNLIVHDLFLSKAHTPKEDWSIKLQDKNDRMGKSIP